MSVFEVAVSGFTRTALSKQCKQKGEEDLVVGASLESEESIVAAVAFASSRR